MDRISYAQTGQDILIEYLMRKRKIITKDPNYAGVYVDIGCNSPKGSSNTYYFYQRGWSGVCIDADPTLIEHFKKVRPRDQCFACAVGLEERTEKFYIFENSQHNTFDADRAKRYPDRVRSSVDIKITPVYKILEEAKVSHIDFMSIDVEGFEHEVLSSMNFEIHRPKIILLEARQPIKTIFDDKITQLLEEKGYELVSHTGHDAFFITK